MQSDSQKPWWELEGKLPPHQEPVDAERERLRSELARAWRSYLTPRDSVVVQPGVPGSRAS
jgi:hypothetical protein